MLCKLSSKNNRKTIFTQYRYIFLKYFLFKVACVQGYRTCVYEAPIVYDSYRFFG